MGLMRLVGKLVPHRCPYGCGSEEGFCGCAQGRVKVACKEKQLRNGKPVKPKR